MLEKNCEDSLTSTRFASMKSQKRKRSGSAKNLKDINGRNIESSTRNLPEDITMQRQKGNKLTLLHGGDTFLMDRLEPDSKRRRKNASLTEKEADVTQSPTAIKSVTQRISPDIFSSSPDENNPFIGGNKPTTTQEKKIGSVSQATFSPNIDAIFADIDFSETSDTDSDRTQIFHPIKPINRRKEQTSTQRSNAAGIYSFFSLETNSQQTENSKGITTDNTIDSTPKSASNKKSSKIRYREVYSSSDDCVDSCVSEIAPSKKKEKISKKNIEVRQDVNTVHEEIHQNQTQDPPEDVIEDNLCKEKPETVATTVQRGEINPQDSLSPKELQMLEDINSLYKILMADLLNRKSNNHAAKEGQANDAIGDPLSKKLKQMLSENINSLYQTIEDDMSKKELEKRASTKRNARNDTEDSVFQTQKQMSTKYINTLCRTIEKNGCNRRVELKAKNIIENPPSKKLKKMLLENIKTLSEAIEDDPIKKKAKRLTRELRTKDGSEDSSFQKELQRLSESASPVDKTNENGLYNREGKDRVMKESMKEKTSEDSPLKKQKQMSKRYMSLHSERRLGKGKDRTTNESTKNNSEDLLFQNQDQMLAADVSQLCKAKNFVEDPPSKKLKKMLLENIKTLSEANEDDLIKSKCKRLITKKPRKVNGAEDSSFQKEVQMPSEDESLSDATNDNGMHNRKCKELAMEEPIRKKRSEDLPLQQKKQIRENKSTTSVTIESGGSIRKGKKHTLSESSSKSDSDDSQFQKQNQILSTDIGQSYITLGDKARTRKSKELAPKEPNLQSGPEDSPSRKQLHATKNSSENFPLQKTKQIRENKSTTSVTIESGGRNRKGKKHTLSESCSKSDPDDSQFQKQDQMLSTDICQSYITIGDKMRTRRSKERAPKEPKVRSGPEDSPSRKQLHAAKNSSEDFPLQKKKQIRENKSTPSVTIESGGRIRKGKKHTLSESSSKSDSDDSQFQKQDQMLSTDIGQPYITIGDKVRTRRSKERAPKEPKVRSGPEDSPSRKQLHAAKNSSEDFPLQKKKQIRENKSTTSVTIESGGRNRKGKKHTLSESSSKSDSDDSQFQKQDQMLSTDIGQSYITIGDKLRTRRSKERAPKEPKVRSGPEDSPSRKQLHAAKNSSEDFPLQKKKQIRENKSTTSVTIESGGRNRKGKKHTLSESSSKSDSDDSQFQKQDQMLSTDIGQSYITIGDKMRTRRSKERASKEPKVRSGPEDSPSRKQLHAAKNSSEDFPLQKKKQIRENKSTTSVTIESGGRNRKGKKHTLSESSSKSDSDDSQFQKQDQMLSTDIGQSYITIGDKLRTRRSKERAPKEPKVRSGPEDSPSRKQLHAAKNSSEDFPLQKKKQIRENKGTPSVTIESGGRIRKGKKHTLSESSSKSDSDDSQFQKQNQMLSTDIGQSYITLGDKARTRKSKELAPKEPNLQSGPEDSPSRKQLQATKNSSEDFPLQKKKQIRENKSTTSVTIESGGRNRKGKKHTLSESSSKSDSDDSQFQKQNQMLSTDIGQSYITLGDKARTRKSKELAPKEPNLQSGPVDSPSRKQLQATKNRSEDFPLQKKKQIRENKSTTSATIENGGRNRKGKKQTLNEYSSKSESDDSQFQKQNQMLSTDIGQSYITLGDKARTRKSKELAPKEPNLQSGPEDSPSRKQLQATKNRSEDFPLQKKKQIRENKSTPSVTIESGGRIRKGKKQTLNESSSESDSDDSQFQKQNQMLSTDISQSYITIGDKVRTRKSKERARKEPNLQSRPEDSLSRKQLQAAKNSSEDIPLQNKKQIRENKSTPSATIENGGRIRKGKKHTLSESSSKSDSDDSQFQKQDQMLSTDIGQSYITIGDKVRTRRSKERAPKEPKVRSGTEDSPSRKQLHAAKNSSEDFPLQKKKQIRENKSTPSVTIESGGRIRKGKKQTLNESSSESDSDDSQFQKQNQMLSTDISQSYITIGDKVRTRKSKERARKEPNLQSGPEDSLSRKQLHAAKNSSEDIPLQNKKQIRENKRTPSATIENGGRNRKGKKQTLNESSSKSDSDDSQFQKQNQMLSTDITHKVRTRKSKERAPKEPKVQSRPEDSPSRKQLLIAENTSTLCKTTEISLRKRKDKSLTINEPKSKNDNKKSPFKKILSGNVNTICETIENELRGRRGRKLIAKEREEESPVAKSQEALSQINVEETGVRLFTTEPKRSNLREETISAGDVSKKKASMLKFEKIIFDKPWQMLKIPHHIFPSFNITKSEFEELREFPLLKVAMPQAIYVSSTLPAYTDICFRRTMAMMTYGLFVKRARTAYFTAKKKRKEVRKSEKRGLFYHKLIDLAALLDSHPDKYFERDYDFYYTGGNLCIEPDNNHFLHVTGKSMDILNLSLFTVEDRQPVVTPLFKARVRDRINNESEIFEVQFSALDRNIYFARQRRTISVIKHTEDKLKIACNFKSENVPFISFAQDKINRNLMAVSNLEQQFRLYDMETNKLTLNLQVVPKAEFTINTNWNMLKSWDSNVYLYTSCRKIYVLDTRVPEIEWRSNYCGFSKNDSCDTFSAVALSNYENLAYFATNHHMYCVDVRHMGHNIENRQASQIRWTHQMKSCPTMMAITRFENCEYILAQSPLEEDLRMFENIRCDSIINFFDENDNSNRYEYKSPCFPYMPSTIGSVLSAAQINGDCITTGSGLEDRIKACYTGIGFAGHNSNPFLLTASSIGDIFARHIHNPDDEKFLPSSIINQYTSLITSSVKKGPLKLSDKANFGGISKVFRCPYMAEATTEIDEDINFKRPRTGRWQKSIKTLHKYKDVLASDLISIWEFPLEETDSSMPEFRKENPEDSLSKVNSWLSKTSGTVENSMSMSLTSTDLNCSINNLTQTQLHEVSQTSNALGNLDTSKNLNSSQPTKKITRRVKGF